MGALSGHVDHGRRVLGSYSLAVGPALEALPYGGRIAVVHEHWDGSSRPRNVDYGTRRLGDRELYPRGGSGGPGDVSPGL